MSKSYLCRVCNHHEGHHLSGGLRTCMVKGCLCRSFSPLVVDDPITVSPTPTAGTSHFEEIAAQVGKLVEEKNAAYGEAFAKCGQFLALLYPDGINPEQYRDALALVRIFDKMNRIATRKDAFGESPYLDMMGYALLGAAMDQEAEPAVSESDAEIRAKADHVAWIVAEHTHDNNPMREALRKCVGGG